MTKNIAKELQAHFPNQPLLKEATMKSGMVNGRRGGGKEENSSVVSLLAAASPSQEGITRRQKIIIFYIASRP